MKKVFTLFLIFIFIFSMGSSFSISAEPNWDVSGTWMLDFNTGTDNREFRNLTQDEEGNVEGEFWYKSSEVWLLGGTLNGNVSGDTLNLHYERPTSFNYTGNFTGTITKSGMSGTFTDSHGGTYNWSTEGSPNLLWDARISGGGQIISDSGEDNAKGKDIYYKISFGGGSYIVNGSYYFDGLEVTFHNVSNNELDGSKFIGDKILAMNFNFPDGIANYEVSGSLDNVPGYKMIIRVQDSDEPGFEDNLRFELYMGSSKVYDSYNSNDFPGNSSTSGTARTYLDRGNIQVEDLRP